MPNPPSGRRTGWGATGAVVPQGICSLSAPVQDPVVGLSRADRHRSTIVSGVSRPTSVATCVISAQSKARTVLSYEPSQYADSDDGEADQERAARKRRDQGETAGHADEL